MDGDSVTITTLADGVTSGALLATRPFQTGEVDATNTSVTVNVTIGPATMPQSQLIGLISSENVQFAQTYVASSGDVVLDANGYDLTGCKLAIFYMNAVPYEVTVNSVVGNTESSTTPVEVEWTVDSSNVAASSTGDAGYLQISELTSAGALTGSSLASCPVDIAEGAEALYISYTGTNTVKNVVTFNVLDATTARTYATFTPDEVALASSFTVTWSDYDVTPESVLIMCVSNDNTVANLPVAFSLSIEQ